MFDWTKKLFGKQEAPEKAAEPVAETLEELTALSQKLGRDQDAIKEQRRAIARLIDAHLTKAH